MRAVNPNEILTVTAPFESDPVPTEFDIVVGITGAERSRLMDLRVEGEQAETKVGHSVPSTLGSFFREVVAFGLRGLRNFTGQNGKPVVLKFVDKDGRRLVAKEVLDELEACLTPGTSFDNLLNWLGIEIWQRSTLTPEQKKTFDERLKQRLSASTTPASSGPTMMRKTGTGKSTTRRAS